MTYFPQPNSSNPARRMKVGGSVVVAIRSESAPPVRAKLHDLSATGGCLLLAKPLEQGDFVEVAFQTSKGTVHGMAEVLVAKRESTTGCMQAFRFVALDDENHSKLNMALDSLMDQTGIGVPSTKTRTI
jgi:c-di-GMP-binding flagellar brake protein YcgR